MKIKINGRKQKVKILKFDDIIGEDCLFSSVIVARQNEPTNAKEYKEMCEKYIENISHWNTSAYNLYQRERVYSGHRGRIYIRIIPFHKVRIIPFNDK